MAVLQNIIRVKSPDRITNLELTWVSGGSALDIGLEILILDTNKKIVLTELDSYQDPEGDTIHRYQYEYVDLEENEEHDPVYENTIVEGPTPRGVKVFRKGDENGTSQAKAKAY